MMLLSSPYLSRVEIMPKTNWNSLRKVISFILVASLISGGFVGCSSHTDIPSTPSPSEVANDEPSPSPSEIANDEPSPSPSEIANDEIIRNEDTNMNTLKNIPSSYFTKTENGGSVVRVDYQTKSYDEKNEILEKYAFVYLPYGYNNDVQYNVFYMLHGGGGEMEYFFGSEGGTTQFKNFIDNMIANGDIEPVIVVTPTYYPMERADTQVHTAGIYTEKFHHELVNDLIPAVEGLYSTFAETTDKDGLKESRDHRAFGGFSMGAVASWYAFIHCLDEFRYFMPMSGDCWVAGQRGGFSHAKETAEYLENAFIDSGHNTDDFFIYTMTGEKDIAFDALDAQIKAMQLHAPSFQFITEDNTSGNICYRVHPLGTHDYNYIQQYIFNALPTFWSGAAVFSSET